MSDEKIDQALATIKQLQKEIQSNKITISFEQSGESKLTAQIQLIEQTENTLTLIALEQCFVAFKKSHEVNAEALIELLAERWHRIRGTSMCYTQQPKNPINLLCIEIAKEVAKLAQAAGAAAEGSSDKKTYYYFLMPSLQVFQDVYGTNLEELSPYEFILSDDQSKYVPLESCLDHFFTSDTGFLTHVVTTDQEYHFLTAGEVQRLSQHSDQVRKLYNVTDIFNAERLRKDTIVSKLTTLAISLRNGGVQRQEEGANEYNAGESANLGIIAFKEYWDKLPSSMQQLIYSKARTRDHNLQIILRRLFNPVAPEPGGTQSANYCVELLAGGIEAILESCSSNLNESFISLEDRVRVANENLQEAIRKDTLIVNSRASPPPQIPLTSLFELSLQKDTKTIWASILEYIVSNQPQTLLSLECSEQFKRQLLLTRLSNQETLLILSVKAGAFALTRTLLLWRENVGVDETDINACDAGQNTALHWAISKKDVAAIKYLIEKGADVNKTRAHNQSALLIAIELSGDLLVKKAIVELLLEHDADITIRTLGCNNILDYAQFNPSIFPSVLMKAALLPLGQQKECLSRLSDGPYENVLWFALTKKPDLFESVIDTILAQAQPELISSLLTSLNSQGELLLARAIRRGHKQAIIKIIDSGIVNFKELRSPNGSTVLHWAIEAGYSAQNLFQKEHISLVKYLIEKGSDVNALRKDSRTALHLAIQIRSEAIVSLLIQSNADVTIRDSAQSNALDLALLTPNSANLRRVLMKAALLPLAQQKECLSRLPDGPYENALWFALAKNPDLFDPLVDTIVTQAPPELRNALFNSLNQKNESLIIEAVKKNQIEGVRKLINSGTINLAEAQCSEGNTALHWAVISKHLEMTELLSGTSLLYARRADGMNALDVAIIYCEESPQLADVMLRHMAFQPLEQQKELLRDLSSSDTVLFYVADQRPNLFDNIIDKILGVQDRVLKQLLLSQLNEAKESAIIKAAQLGKVESLRKLLGSQEFDLDVTDSSGNTALHWAIANSHSSAIPYLATPNSLLKLNDNGKSPLELASDSANLPLIKASIAPLGRLTLTQQTTCLGRPLSDEIFNAIIENRTLFNSLTGSNGEHGNTRAVNMLSQIHFDKHMREIHKHLQQMQKKSERNPKYQSAVSETKTLLRECIKSKITLLQGEFNSDNVNLFRTTCQRTVNQVKPVLKEHRALAKLITGLIIAILTFPISLPLCAAGFFSLSLKTKSSRLLNQFNKGMEKSSNFIMG